MFERVPSSFCFHATDETGRAADGEGDDDDDDDEHVIRGLPFSEREGSGRRAAGRVTR